MLAVLGSVMSLDPRTGAAFGEIWSADRCVEATPTRSYQAAEFPVQSGATVSDAILAGPETLSVVYLLSDAGSTGHKVPPSRGRAYKLAQRFQEIERRKGPVRLWVQGYPPLSWYAMESVTPARVTGTYALQLTVGYRRLDFTSVTFVSGNVSDTLLSLGLLPL